MQVCYADKEQVTTIADQIQAALGFQFYALKLLEIHYGVEKYNPICVVPVHTQCIGINVYIAFTEYILIKAFNIPGLDLS